MIMTSMLSPLVLILGVISHYCSNRSSHKDHNLEYSQTQRSNTDSHKCITLSTTHLVELSEKNMLYTKLPV